jgi:hypothetical protein
MLDLRFFRDPRFSAAIVAIMSLFFGLFGLMFVSTQTLQSVLGYDTLGAGLRLVPLPAMFVVFAQISVRVAARAGTKRVVTAGLVIAATGLGVGASLDAGSGYGVLAVALSLTGIGMGCTMAPAIESIMGSVPRQRAGVASAVNDTTRLTAGAIGVAVVGSVLSSGSAAHSPPTAPPAPCHPSSSSRHRHPLPTQRRSLTDSAAPRVSDCWRLRDRDSSTAPAPAYSSPRSWRPSEQSRPGGSSHRRRRPHPAPTRRPMRPTLARHPHTTRPDPLRRTGLALQPIGWA